MIHGIIDTFEITILVAKMLSKPTIALMVIVSIVRNSMSYNNYLT